MTCKLSGTEGGPLLREPEVLQRVRFSRATLQRLVAQAQFPPPVKLSAKIRAWKADDVAHWIETRPRGGR